MEGYTILIFFFEVTLYYLASYILTGVKLKRFWLPVCSLFAYLLFIQPFVGVNVTNSITYVNILSVLTVFVLQNNKIQERIKNTLFLIFFVYCIRNFITTLIEGIAHNRNDELLFIMDTRVNYVFVCSIQLVIFLLTFFIKIKLPLRFRLKIFDIIQKKIALFIILGGIVILLNVSGQDWLRGRGAFNEVVQSIEFYNFSWVLCLLSYLCICMWGLFYIYTENTNKKMEQMIENEKSLIGMQKKYYDTLLEREDDTKKFRHDIFNHLIILNEMYERKSYDELGSYIKNMYTNLSEIRNSIYFTGNDILDILTNHYVSLVSENTAVTVKGYISYVIEPMKLCTIYANLLQNAIEELDKCDEDKVLNIEFFEGNDYAMIMIENTLSLASEKAIKDEEFVTTKKDTSMHGFGLKNVKKTVSELDGNMEISTENHMYKVIIYFKI